MNPVKFTLFTLVGSAVWNTVLCSLGAAAGSAWMTVSEQAEWVSDIVKYVIIAIVAVVAVFWIVKRIIPNLRQERNAAKGASETGHTPKHMR